MSTTSHELSASRGAHLSPTAGNSSVRNHTWTAANSVSISPIRTGLLSAADEKSLALPTAEIPNRLSPRING